MEQYFQVGEVVIIQSDHPLAAKQNGTEATVLEVASGKADNCRKCGMELHGNYNGIVYALSVMPNIECAGGMHVDVWKQASLRKKYDGDMDFKSLMTQLTKEKVCG